MTEEEYRIVFVGDKKIDAYIFTALGTPRSILKARGKFRSKAEDIALICQREYGAEIEKINLYDTTMTLEGGEVKHVSAVDIYLKK